MQMGMQYGQRVWSEGNRSVSRFLPVEELRKRFHVSHAYVRSKLAMLVLPATKNSRKPSQAPRNFPEPSCCRIMAPLLPVKVSTRQ